METSSSAAAAASVTSTSTDGWSGFAWRVGQGIWTGMRSGKGFQVHEGLQINFTGTRNSTSVTILTSGPHALQLGTALTGPRAGRWV